MMPYNTDLYERSRSLSYTCERADVGRELTTEEIKMNTMKDMFEKVKTDGGCIVSSGDCCDMEIASARARGDFYVDEAGFGYVRRLNAWLIKHSRYARGATDSCEHLSDT